MEFDSPAHVIDIPFTDEMGLNNVGTNDSTPMLPGWNDFGYGVKADTSTNLYQEPCPDADAQTKQTLRGQGPEWINHYETTHGCKIDWGENPPVFSTEEVAPEQTTITSTERTIPVTPQSPMGIFSSESDPTQAPPTATTTATSESIGQDNGLQNNIGGEIPHVSTLCGGLALSVVVGTAFGVAAWKRYLKNLNVFKVPQTGAEYLVEGTNPKDGTPNVRDQRSGKRVTSTDSSSHLGRAHQTKTEKRDAFNKKINTQQSEPKYHHVTLVIRKPGQEPETIVISEKSKRNLKNAEKAYIKSLGGGKDVILSTQNTDWNLTKEEYVEKYFTE